MDGLRRWRNGGLKLFLLTGVFFTTTVTLRAESVQPAPSVPTNQQNSPSMQRSSAAEVRLGWQQQLQTRIDEFRVELARELLMASMTMIGGHGMTTPPPPPPPPPPSDSWYVHAGLVDLTRRRTYQLLAGDTRLGRGIQNDIVLDDPAISREHLLIRQEGDQFVLFDRGSHIGTLVNSHSIAGPCLLQHGDTITVGDTELEFATASQVSYVA